MIINIQYIHLELFEFNTQDGIKYLKENNNLAMDVLDLMDIVKVLLGVQLDINLKTLDHTVLLYNPVS